MRIPKELSNLFEEKHFANYPIVEIPQSFSDERGSIENIADGTLGDVAVITSAAGAMRANHVHKDDWHLSYMLQGSMNYFWKDEFGKENIVVVSSGQMVYSPPGTPHKMLFLEASSFVAIAAKNRSSENYESDTTRLPEDYFSS
jgi:uncharacterized RmlC-like cupin family protein